MCKTIVLRFRDLSTNEGETIDEHTNIISRMGGVWWGWWMKQYDKGWMDQDDSAPRLLFRNVANEITRNGHIEGFLFDSGLMRFYTSTIVRIALAPTPDLIHSPVPNKTPPYYVRKTCPAWFLFSNIDEVDFNELSLVYDAFPTKEAQPDSYRHLVGQPVASLEQLRETQTTLWAVKCV